MRGHGGAWGLVADIFRRRIVCRLCVPGSGARKRRAAHPSSTGHRHGARGNAAQADHPAKAVAKPWRRGARPAVGSNQPAPPAPAASRPALHPRRRRPAAHRRQRHAHQRRRGECRSFLAGRRGAGGRARPDRHPAFRRGQSQPVFSAWLQSRPRHRSFDHRRRHARQHADPRPRAGLRRYQFHDPGADPVDQCPQGSVLRRCRRLRLRRRGRDRLRQQAAEKHRRDDVWQFRLSSRAGRRLDRGRRRHAARRDRGRQIQRSMGRAGQCAQDQRRDALQPGHRDRWLDADGDGLFQRLEFDRPGGAARDRPGHHRPLRHARSDRRRRLQPLQPVRQFCAFERIRAEQDQRLCHPLRFAALQQFHLFPRQPRQWRPVQPARPPHPRRLRCAPRLRLALWRA